MVPAELSFLGAFTKLRKATISFVNTYKNYKTITMADMQMLDVPRCDD